MTVLRAPDRSDWMTARPESHLSIVGSHWSRGRNPSLFTPSRLLSVVAGFQLSINGRFWVSTEESSLAGHKVPKSLVRRYLTENGDGVTAIKGVNMLEEPQDTFWFSLASTDSK